MRFHPYPLDGEILMLLSEYVRQTMSLSTLHCHFIGTIESIMQGNYSQLPIEPLRMSDFVIDKCFWPGHDIKCF